MGARPLREKERNGVAEAEHTFMVKRGGNQG